MPGKEYRRLFQAELVAAELCPRIRLRNPWHATVGDSDYFCQWGDGDPPFEICGKAMLAEGSFGYEH